MIFFLFCSSSVASFARASIVEKKLTIDTDYATSSSEQPLKKRIKKTPLHLSGFNTLFLNERVLEDSNNAESAYQSSSEEEIASDAEDDTQEKSIPEVDLESDSSGNEENDPLKVVDPQKVLGSSESEISAMPHNNQGTQDETPVPMPKKRNIFLQTQLIELQNTCNYILQINEQLLAENLQLRRDVQVLDGKISLNQTSQEGNDAEVVAVQLPIASHVELIEFQSALSNAGHRKYVVSMTILKNVSRNRK
jgi:hypothetical protein